MNQTIERDYDTQSGLPTWRIADGELRTGREVDGTLQVRKNIGGDLLRIGVFAGENKQTGEPFAQLECELNTARGKEIVKTNLESKVSSAMFGMALLGATKGETFIVEPRKAAEPTKYGNYVTFVTGFRWDERAGRSSQILTDKDEFDGETMSDKLPHILEALKSHPAYQERQQRPSDDEDAALAFDHREAFDAACKERDWPRYIGNEGAYEKLFNSWLVADDKDPLEPGEALDEDTWIYVRQKLEAVPKKRPKVLETAIKAAPAAPEKEEDPFADE